MQSWTLVDYSESDAALGIAGYAVLDALGVRLGHVSGWIKDPDDRIQMLKVAVTEWSGANEYLIPVGSVTLINDGRRQIHLRDLTKPVLSRRCLRFDGAIPEARLLKRSLRHFPVPRVSVEDHLQTASQHEVAPKPNWTNIRALASPPWEELGA